MPDRVATAGGKYAAEAMAKDTWNRIGLSTFYRIGTREDVTEEYWEKALKTFPLTALGTFIKSSDKGLDEEYEKSIKSVTIQEARDALEAKAGIEKLIAEKGNLSEDEKTALIKKRKSLDEMIERATKMKHGSPFIRAYTRAATKPKRMLL